MEAPEKMFFHEFLVASGIVKVEAIVNALVLQMQSLKSIGEVVAAKGWLNASELYQVFLMQQRRNLDFRSAAQNLGLWSDSLNGKVMSEIGGNSKGIVEILLKNHALSVDDLVMAFDRFAEEQKLTENRQNVEIAPKNDGTSLGLGNSDQVSSEEVMRLVCLSTGALNHLMVAEFQQVYSDALGPRLREVNEKIAAWTGQSAAGKEKQAEEVLRLALAQFSGLRAAAGFLGAQVLTNVSSNVVRCLEGILAHRKTESMTQGIMVVKAAIGLTTLMVDVISEFENEATMATDSNLLDLFQRLLSSVKGADRILGRSQTAA